MALHHVEEGTFKEQPDRLLTAFSPPKPLEGAASPFMRVGVGMNNATPLSMSGKSHKNRDRNGAINGRKKKLKQSLLAKSPI